MQRRWVALLIALATMLSACAGTTEGLVGAELYDRSCAACHGGDGGGGSGPALGPGSNAVQLSDDQIAGAIRVGPGTMPSFDRLTDEQVDSLVAHIRDLQSR